MAENSLRQNYRRDFSAERIAAPAGQAPAPALPSRYPSKWVIASNAVAVIVLIGVAVVGFNSFHTKQSKNPPAPQPKAQTAASGPTKTLGASTTPSSTPPTSSAPAQVQGSSVGTLPNSFHVNNDKQTSNGITTYSISDSSNNTYNVVEEPITATNTQDSFAKSLSNTETLTVNLGKAVIGDTSSEVLAGIQTSDGHLVIVDAPSTSLRTQLEALIKSM